MVAETAGYTFNPGSTQQLATFLYDNLGLAAGRRTKTGRSTDADSLESLRGEHAVVDVILEWRQLTKLKSTYVDALPLLCAADGRVHTSFNQAVASTGRLSSADPNLQNVPVRTAWGQRIRHAFVADPGQQLVSADYSQIELRVLAHVSGEPELIAAFERGEDIHRRTAAEVYDVAPEERHARPAAHRQGGQLRRRVRPLRLRAGARHRHGPGGGARSSSRSTSAASRR